jgi:glycosyltransferase involved in cell wall biosynthesis
MANCSRIELSVVVCTYNRADWLRGALDSLKVQTLESARFEVLLVDNNSTDDTALVASRYRDTMPNLRYLKEEQQGLSYARNLGWQSANGEFVAFLDDDARAAADWCEGVLTAFRTVLPQPVSVGGRILPMFDAPLPAWFTEELEIRTWGDSSCFLDAQTARYGFSGSNMAFPKEVLIRYGGFSTSLGMQGRKIRLGEDSLLFSRIQDREPLLWYDPSLIVHHLVPQRNLGMKYRLTRAYAAGRSLAFMQRERDELNSWWVELNNTAYFIKELITSLFSERQNPAAQFRKLSDLVKQCGLLMGRLLPEDK